MTLREAIGDRPLPCLIFDERSGDVFSVLKSCDGDTRYHMQAVFLQTGHYSLILVRNADSLYYRHYTPAFEENDPLIVGRDTDGVTLARAACGIDFTEPHCPCPIHIQAEHNIGCEYAAWKRARNR